jgi:hypothetical protein
MLVHAMNLRVRDMLSDGTVIASLSRSQGHTYAKLIDGRRLIAPDHYLLGVTRPKPPDDPLERAVGLLEGAEGAGRINGRPTPSAV